MVSCSTSCSLKIKKMLLLQEFFLFFHFFRPLNGFFCQLESTYHIIAVSLCLCFNLYIYLKNIKMFWVLYCYKRCWNLTQEVNIHIESFIQLYLSFRKTLLLQALQVGNSVCMTLLNLFVLHMIYCIQYHKVLR